jgi:hypothetical protein
MLEVVGSYYSADTIQAVQRGEATSDAQRVLGDQPQFLRGPPVPTAPDVYAPAGNKESVVAASSSPRRGCVNVSSIEAHIPDTADTAEQPALAGLEVSMSPSRSATERALRDRGAAAVSTAASTASAALSVLKDLSHGSKL